MKIISVLLLAWLAGVGPVFSQENTQAQFPVHLGFVHPLNVMGKKSETMNFNFSLAALTGKIGGLRGCAINGLVGVTRQQASGLQIAGLVNKYDEGINGATIGGLVNKIDSSLSGLAIAGLVNKVDGDVAGLQIGGLTNAAQDVRGMQIGGLVNRARYVRGVQIGLINKADSVSGAQIGLLNLVEEGGYYRLELSATETGLGQLAFLTGSRGWYTGLGLVAGPQKGRFFSGLTGIMGSQIRLGSTLSVQLEGRYTHLNGPAEVWTRQTQELYSFIPALNFHKAGGLEWFIGPSFNVSLARVSQRGELPAFAVPYSLFTSYTQAYYDNERDLRRNRVDGWIGLRLGVRI